MDLYPERNMFIIEEMYILLSLPMPWVLYSEGFWVAYQGKFDAGDGQCFIRQGIPYIYSIEILYCKKQNILL